MFGIESTLLAFIVLAGFSAGGLAYGFLFNRIADQKQADRRLEARLDMFRRLAAERSLRVLSSTAPADELNLRIQELIGVADER